ncbi:MAG TPA: hemerythrin domain-containing protein [Planctomycetota bacterium]
MGSSVAPRALTRILAEEHVQIRRVLEAFARYASWVCAARDYDPRLARRFLRFFREFGDLRHHEEEEELLFPWLEAHGLPRGVGPLVVLRHEHELGRELRLALAAAADALLEQPLDADERERFRELALRYVELGLAHMDKEEGALFPLVEELAAGDAVLTVARELPARERAWIDEIEARAAAWPAPGLTLLEHGSAESFGRLCAEALVP